MCLNCYFGKDWRWILTRKCNYGAFKVPSLLNWAQKGLRPITIILVCFWMLFWFFVFWCAWRSCSLIKPCFPTQSAMINTIIYAAPKPARALKRYTQRITHLHTNQMTVSWFGLEARVSRYPANFDRSEIILPGKRPPPNFSKIKFKHIRID